MDWKTMQQRTPWGTLIVFGVGIPVTIVGYAMMLLFAATYWRWLG